VVEGFDSGGGWARGGILTLGRAVVRMIADGTGARRFRTPVVNPLWSTPGLTTRSPDHSPRTDVLHIMAITQIRHDTPGCAYYWPGLRR